MPSPESEETFKRRQLCNEERLEGIHGQGFALHRDLIQLEKSDPVLAGPARRGLDAQTLTRRAFLVRHFGALAGDDRLRRFGLDTAGLTCNRESQGTPMALSAPVPPFKL